MNLRMDENGDVSEHLNEFFDIINQLSGLNFDIENEQQVIMLLNSLIIFDAQFNPAILYLILKY